MRTRMRNRDGSVSVMVFAAIPILAAMLLLIVDVGRIAITRARLQMATDRAAYAGAASLANSLNRIASSNWELHKAFRDLEWEFETNSQNGESTAQQRKNEYVGKRDAAYEDIESVIDGMEAAALYQAESVLQSNSPVGGRDIRIMANPNLSKREVTLGYDPVEGQSLPDPDDVPDTEYYEAVSHLAKGASQDASVGIYATAEVTPLMLGVLREDSVEVHAASAAAAFGGSIEGFALKDVDSLEEAEAEMIEEDYDGLYRSSLVPVWTATDYGEPIFH